MQAERTRPRGRDEYHAYLLTPEWKAKRQAALKRAGHRCQLCNRDKQLQVHHRTYERVGNEEPGDLTVLCNDCHEKFHGIDGSQPMRVVTSERVPKRQKTKAAAKKPRTVNPHARNVVELLQPGRAYTVRDIAALADILPSAVAPAVSAMVREGVLVQTGGKKKRYQLPSKPQDPLTVPCPTCGAPQGKTCPMGGVHLARQVEASKRRLPGVGPRTALRKSA